MKDLRNLFVGMRAAGTVAVIILCFHVEWRFIHGNLSNALNLLVQLYVIASVLILPLFWLLFAITLFGHFGARAVQKRRDRPAAEDSEGFRPRA